MATTYRINKELKLLNLKIQKHDERLYHLHFNVPKNDPPLGTTSKTL
jgi:hypothetical protein